MIYLPCIVLWGSKYLIYTIENKSNSYNLVKKYRVCGLEVQQLYITVLPRRIGFGGGEHTTIYLMVIYIGTNILQANHGHFQSMMALTWSH